MVESMESDPIQTDGQAGTYMWDVSTTLCCLYVFYISNAKLIDTVTQELWAEQQQEEWENSFPSIEITETLFTVIDVTLTRQSVFQCTPFCQHVLPILSFLPREKRWCGNLSSGTNWLGKYGCFLFSSSAHYLFPIFLCFSRHEVSFSSGNGKSRQRNLCSGQEKKFTEVVMHPHVHAKVTGCLSHQNGCKIHSSWRNIIDHPSIFRFIAYPFRQATLQDDSKHTTETEFFTSLILGLLSTNLLRLIRRVTVCDERCDRRRHSNCLRRPIAKLRVSIWQRGASAEISSVVPIFEMIAVFGSRIEEVVGFIVSVRKHVCGTV